MTAAEMMQLTALKTTALSAMNACRAVVQGAEAMMMAADQTDNDPTVSTFEDSQPGVPHGTQKLERGRKLR